MHCKLGFSWLSAVRLSRTQSSSSAVHQHPEVYVVHISLAYQVIQVALWRCPILMACACSLRGKEGLFSPFTDGGTEGLCDLPQILQELNPQLLTHRLVTEAAYPAMEMVKSAVPGHTCARDCRDLRWPFEGRALTLFSPSQVPFPAAA